MAVNVLRLQKYLAVGLLRRFSTTPLVPPVIPGFVIFIDLTAVKSIKSVCVCVCVGGAGGRKLTDLLRIFTSLVQASAPVAGYIVGLSSFLSVTPNNRRDSTAYSAATASFRIRFISLFIKVVTLNNLTDTLFTASRS